MARGDARVAVVGATGTVGSQIAELLGTRGFPLAELKLFGRDSSSQAVESGERTLPVARFNSVEDIANFDIAFLAVERTHAAELVAARPGPVLIDLSAAIVAPDTAVPLVCPGLTQRERIADLAPTKLLGVPHPASQVIAAVLKAIGGDGFAGATVMLSASAGGHQVISELFQQSAELLNARLDLAEEQPQIAFNVLPAMHSHELSTIVAQQVSLLIGRSGGLAVQVVRVPAFHGCGAALSIPASEDSGEWAARLRSFPGLILVESNESSGFTDAVGQEAVIVSLSLTSAGATLWCVFDAARLAALTAVWIAESLVMAGS